MGKNSAFEMSFLLSQGFSPTKWMFFALFTDDRAPSAKGITRSALVFAREVVSERRLYGSAGIHESYSILPWMGLHTVDTIRRGTAQKQIWFETKYNKRSGRTEVILKHEGGRIVDTVDMEKDVIEQITFSKSHGRQEN